MIILIQTASIIFLDGPVGAGFSYATTQEAWNTTDTQYAAQADAFLRNVSLIDE
jgi:serine carboxypeptidase-like clade 1